MTQPGETDGYSVKDHIDAIHRQAGQPFIDYAFMLSFSSSALLTSTGLECFSSYFFKT
jgi:2-phospho-L-lactate transferase/gluconeogenesis factor (CofD/UPF0052 family)